MINIKLPIMVNGVTKIATGITKETTIDNLKFAMLFPSTNEFKNFHPQILNEYKFIEIWQNNERVLDGNLKVYKHIKTWMALPGDQLSQIKFIIKPAQKSSTQEKEFKYCSLSPEIQKTWNEDMVQRRKQASSYVKQQLLKLQPKFDADIVSINSIPASSFNDEEEQQQKANLKFASIKRFQLKSGESSLKRVKETKKLNFETSESIKKIEKLKLELKNIEQQLNINKIKQEKENLKNESLDILKSKLSKLDNIIFIKTQLINELEIELKKLNQLNDTEKVLKSSSSSTSSLCSTDTGFGSSNSDCDENELNCNKFETLV